MRRRRSRRRRPRTDADVADTRRPDLRDLRAHPAGGRARAALRAARGRRTRRRLPAVRRRGDRAGMAEGGVADDPDRPRRAPEAKALAVGDLRPPTHAARGRDGRTRADPAPPLGAGARHGGGGRPVQCQRLPAHRRRDRKEPRPPEGEHRAAFGGEHGGCDHRRVGHLLVPVPRHRRLGAAGAARGAGARATRARPARSPDACDRAGIGAGPAATYNLNSMIYCVIPSELEDELFDRLTEYYKDNANVTVIVDRRSGPDRRSLKEPTEEEKERRELRDRRRRRPGTFPPTDVPETA